MKRGLPVLLSFVVFFLPACRGNSPKEEGLSALIYITGVRAGSPSYEMLAAGAEEFAAENPGVRVKVYEAGFNQAEWEEQLTSLVAGGEYGVVLGSNPSLPEICDRVGKKFPEQKFIITDAMYDGNDQICTYLYNQYEQSLFLGFLAGLITTGGMEHSNGEKRIGFVAAQEYPLLTRHILPGFIEGARRADPEITLDFRVIGNWSDVNKAADLASGMIDAGADVLAAIAGGAAQGVIRTAERKGAYMVVHNTNEYASAPGVILGCGIMEQKKLAREILADALAGRIAYGTSRIIGIREGSIDYLDADPGYLEYAAPEIREKFDAFMEELRAGRIAYTVPPL
jgi:simple sugar transport system substrate-binding protein